MRTFNEQELKRRNDLEEFKKLGINPYPPNEFKVSHYSTIILNDFSLYENKEVILAGRLMSRRLIGKAAFIELQDSKGRIQIYINRDDISKTENKIEYNVIFKKLLDIGDFIGIKGIVFKTQVGEISIHASELTVLSKTLHPLPIVKTDANGVIHDAFSDIEKRYRMRYVDLIVNKNVKEIFTKRTKTINVIREFLNKKEYLEVETPILHPIPGGASAKPFITHHNALDHDLYLRIANELYLKRLIVGGYDGVYEFAKDFRNEGMDRTHNPEFTVMELYVAYKDYYWMMQTTEELLQKVSEKVCGSSNIIFQDKEIEFKGPYPKIPILKAIETHIGINIEGKNQLELIEICKNLGIEADETMGIGKLIDEIFGEKCEHHYIQPTFIIDYPKEMSPLTKKHRKKEGLTERFELIINGKEIANSYSELNDPIDQLNRFEEQLKLSEKGDDEAMFIDYDFIRALEYGMPPTAGIGIGIDRLVMLLTNQTSIQEVLFFPQMKPEKKQIALTDEEKAILEILTLKIRMPLEELKKELSLSNKKWDKSLKNLNSQNLTKVEKTEEGIFIEKK